MAAAPSAIAATLYVDGTLPSASCTNYDVATRSCGSGSATAYRTVDATFPVAVAGDSVVLRGGVYAEGDRQGPQNSGTAGSPITFRAQAGESVHVQGTLDARNAASTTASPFDLSSRAFIELDGFEISGYGLCIRLDASSDIAIRRMNIHDCGQGIWITNHSARVVITDLESSHNSFRDGGASVNVRGATDVRVERASATMNSGDPAVGAIEGDGFHADDFGNQRLAFIDCVATDNEDDGFDLTGVDVRIERCVAARNIVGFKLWDEHCDPSTCPPTPTRNHFVVVNAIAAGNSETGLFAQNGPDIEIYNALFVDNRYEGVRLMQNLATLPDDPAHAVMQNDLFVSNGSWGRRFESAGADNTDWVLTSDHNLFFANGYANAVWSGEDVSTVQSDPLLVSAATGDFHLRAGSPAIDTGRDLSSLFTTDADRAGRPAGAAWDRGPYEYGAMNPGDAGVTDASVDVVTPGDAMTDAMISDSQRDASADAAADAGNGSFHGGCGCRTSRTAMPREMTLLVAGIAVAVMRRRRTPASIQRI